MNENYNDVSKQLFELANEAYRTYVKSLVWTQERALALTKAVVEQLNTFENEGKGLVEEYTNQVQRAQQIFQGIWQENVKSGSDLVNQYRLATNQNLADINARLDAVQSKMEVPAKAKTA
ncbi:MAG TPA: hypothetical protein VH186_28045 [Chloroflexia bacterium]|nr:hypothetical protein [Chloroflexia bacterium]